MVEVCFDPFSEPIGFPLTTRTARWSIVCLIWNEGRAATTAWEVSIILSPAASGGVEGPAAPATATQQKADSQFKFISAAPSNPLLRRRSRLPVQLLHSDRRRLEFGCA